MTNTELIVKELAFDDKKTEDTVKEASFENGFFLFGISCCNTNVSKGLNITANCGFFHAEITDAEGCTKKKVLSELWTDLHHRGQLILKDNYGNVTCLRFEEVKHIAVKAPKPWKTPKL